MKAEEFINSCDINHLLRLKDKQTIEINIRSFVGQAASMVRKEEQERAFKVLEFILDEWVHGGDAECILEEFKNGLEGKK